MGLWDPYGLHERGDVISIEFGGVGPCGFIRFTGASQVHGDTGEVLGILGDLKRITGVISRQIRDEDERLSCSLLVVVHGDLVDADFGHGAFSFLHPSLERVLTLAPQAHHEPLACRGYANDLTVLASTSVHVNVWNSAGWRLIGLLLVTRERATRQFSKDTAKRNDCEK